MKRHILPTLLITCTLIVALWLVMARQSSQPFKPFDLTAKDFIGFEPDLPGWSVRSIPVSTSDPAEPNIAAYIVESAKEKESVGVEDGKRKEESGKREAESGERQEVSGKRTAATTLPANSHSRLPRDTSVSRNSDTPTSPYPDTLSSSRFPLAALIRLVHGYNMPMCMKIKGYTVVAIGDHCGVEKKLSGSQVAGRKPGDSADPQGLREPVSSDSSSAPNQPGNETTQHPALSSFSSSSPTPLYPHTPTPLPASLLPLTSASDTPTPHYPDTLPPSPSSLSALGAPRSPLLPPPTSPFPHQLWRVISSNGERSIWVTTMIRAGDFSPTSVDVCSMAFPRVDVPDDPGWIPRGLTGASLRHPVASLKQWGRARWNASRTDLLTFLRLRQPAWASEELLTYVTCSIDPAVKSDNEGEIVRAVVLAHTEMLEVLRVWRIAQVGMK